ncbi:5-deoxy-glucuronate isomerase [Candidatus Wolfebacteria bacterium]|nr:5-deoxy-glucuronate isomerase [Candidatus Wolfebacteria bacterium]
MYKWSNKQLLDTLKVGGGNNILKFSAGSEKVEVYLEDGDIARVAVLRDGENNIIIDKKDCRHVVVGEGNTQRDVYHYLTPGGPTQTMRLGITKHCGKNTWSSLPHHFELETEPGFEEVFFYILKGGPERAIQVGRGVWYDNVPVDAVWPVRSHTFGTVPMGYHPVVGEPEVCVSYVWVYLAKKDKWEKVKK